MLEGFMAYLENEVESHSIFVSGARGQKGSEITEQWIRGCEGLKIHADRSVAFWKKQCAAGYKNQLSAFDGGGLGTFWLCKHHLLQEGSTPEGLRVQCKQIERAQVQRGDWLFIMAGGRAAHVAFATSPQACIEARGRDWGVVKSQIDQRNFGYFARPFLFEHQIEGGSLDAGAHMDKLLTATDSLMVKIEQSLEQALGFATQLEEVLNGWEHSRVQE